MAAPRRWFLLRIDPPVPEAVQRWANDDLRSLRGQIEFLLRRALQESGRSSTRPAATATPPPGQPRQTTSRPATRSRPANYDGRRDRRPYVSAFLFVLFLFGWAEASGGPQRLSGVEQRQARHVKGGRALRRLVGDDDDNRAAFHTLAEGDTATAGEPGVHETFEHLAR